MRADIVDCILCGKPLYVKEDISAAVGSAREKKANLASKTAVKETETRLQPAVGNQHTSTDETDKNLSEGKQKNQGKSIFGKFDFWIFLVGPIVLVCLCATTNFTANQSQGQQKNTRQHIQKTRNTYGAAKDCIMQELRKKYPEIIVSFWHRDYHQVFEKPLFEPEKADILRLKKASGRLFLVTQATSTIPLESKK